MTAVDWRADHLEYVESTLSCSLSRCILAKDANALKRILCKRKKNPIPLQADSRGWTALHVAASKDEHADCLAILLRNKDILSLNLNAKTLTGKTALYLACDRGCVNNCRILLETQCDPEESKLDGSTVLHIASRNGHFDIVSQLIACGMNSNCKDSYGKTPLHVASLHDKPDVVRVLMRSRQTKLNIRDEIGNIPLHFACEKGAVKIMKILLETDHSLVHSRNHSAVTPLMMATLRSHIECVKYLLDHGANADQCTIRTTDTDGHLTTLHYAIMGRDKEVLELVLQNTSFTYVQEQCILGIRSSLSAETYFWSLISYLIASNSPPECLSLLLESGIPKNVFEAPTLMHNDRFCDVYSPLAFLFSYSFTRQLSRSTRDKFLHLLLQYDIAHVYNFSQMVDLKSTCTLSLRYVHPFNGICWDLWMLEQCDKPNHYLNRLIENGITTDYCLQCDVNCKSTFENFDVNDLECFYKPVTSAIIYDNAKLVELFIINSVILEPSHLWDYLQHRGSIFPGCKNPQNVVNYLIDLGVDISTSNLPLYPFGGTIKCPNLQQLCRQAIRKHLRDVTFRDNLKNFKGKINALPLPDLLKNYLHFKRR